MLYRYKSIHQETGEEKQGTIEAATVDIGINALQRRKLIIISIVAVETESAFSKLFKNEGKVNYLTRVRKSGIEEVTC
jgi:type II secretory pathway component PulF